MALKIKQDHARFRDIVRGRIKRNLKKYVQKGEMIGKKGKDFITIPVPTISPFWTYFFRLRLIRPRTMSRNRAWSCLILSDIPGPHSSSAGVRARFG